MAAGTTNTRTTSELHSLFTQTGGVTGAFTSKVDDYVASRPDYPSTLFDALRASGALFGGARIADIGAGTGLLTRQLLERGYAVTAVEPNAAMRAAADQLLSSRHGYRSIGASAEATTLADDSIDLITVAQAFHWFEVAAVRREWLRILKPHGRVALVWNTRPLDDPLQQAIDDVLDEFGGVRHTVLAAQQELSTVPPFFAGAPFEELKLPHAHRLVRDAFLSLVFSRSSMPDRNTAAGSRAERVIAHLFELFAESGAVTVNYLTVAFVGRPNPAAQASESPP
jgi:SAM-dependent methyltransferase